MNTTKQTQAATWLAGATSLIVTSQANAAVVIQDLNLDFTTTLDGQVVFQGISSLVEDTGQWRGYDNSASDFASVNFHIAGNSAIFNLNTVRGTGSFALGTVSGASAGSGTFFSTVSSPASNPLPAGRAAQGYIRWNLSDSTQGWLRVRADRPSMVGPGNPVTLTVTGFVYDDATPTTRAAIADVEAVGGDAGLIPLPVPEPSSLSLLALGAMGIISRRKRNAA